MIVIAGRSRGFPASKRVIVSGCSLRSSLIASRPTVKRYSTALSTLKKAARRAASICARSKPMAIISVMAPSLAAPMAMELSVRSGSACVAGAGVGVAGMVEGAGLDAAVGAEGTAGVAATGLAGVWGTALEEEAAAVAGAALG